MVLSSIDLGDNDHSFLDKSMVLDHHAIRR